MTPESWQKFTEYMESDEYKKRRSESAKETLRYIKESRDRQAAVDISNTVINI